MNICITTKSLARGGAETLIFSICIRLIAKGHTVTIIYFEANDNDFSNQLSDIGCNVNLISLSRYNVLSKLYEYFLLLKSGNFDVIFEHSPLISSFTRIINYLILDTKLFYLEHSVPENYHFLTRITNKITYSLTTQIICCSNQVHASNGGFGVVLENAISINSEKGEFSFSEFTNDFKVIVSVANTSKVKNQELLISAFEKVKYKNVKLVIVGDRRDNFDNLSNKINNSSRKRDIYFLGPRTDVLDILSSCDIFSLTSLYEGLPMSLLEAMSQGVVPVCTDVGGISSVIEDGVDGYVVDEFCPHKIAHYFDLILENEELQERMGRLAREKVYSDYSINNYVDKLVSYFKGLS